MLSRCLVMITAVLVAAAAPARADALLDAITQARQHCAPGAPALQVQSRLNEVARRIAQGAPLASALEAAGYRAQRSYQWSMRGYPSPDAVGQALQKQCATLGRAELTEVGAQRRGDAYWIVAAAPFAPPAQGRAGDVAARVLALVNQARTQPRRCGGRAFEAAAPLTLDATLTRAAGVHANAMAQGGFLEHTGRDGSTPADRASRAGYDWRSIGENIASGQTTPERVMQDWLRSPEHCANIMEPRFTQMGVAFAVNPSSEGGIYWAQAFGRPK
jgi:uncharacterized protein YkwD